MRVRIDDYTWPEIRRLIDERDPIVIVPVGAVEQHGHHLPLAVDWRTASEVARRAAERAVDMGKATLVTPPIWTGFSPHHMDFAGTITLRADTFIHVLVDAATSLHHHGFRRILFLNGHGGNANLMRSAVQRLRFEYDVRAAAASYWDFAIEAIERWRMSEKGGINHACEMETSLMLALRPETVRLDRIMDHPSTVSKHVSSDLTEGGALATAPSFSELTPHGTLGMPSLASAERGADLLEDIVAAVTAFLSDFATSPGPAEASRD